MRTKQFLFGANAIVPTGRRIPDGEGTKPGKGTYQN
jgi:hypothetical protein